MSIQFPVNGQNLSNEPKLHWRLAKYASRSLMCNQNVSYYTTL